MAEVGDVSPRRYRRHRCSSPRDSQHPRKYSQRRIARNLPRAAAPRGDGPPRLDRRQNGQRLLQAREKVRRRIRDPHARSRENGVPPAAEGALRFHRSGKGHRGHARAAAHAGRPRARRKGRRQGAEIHLGSDLRHVPLRRAPRARNCRLHRGCGPRHALGICLGTRAVRGLGRHRRRAHGQAAGKRGQRAAAARHGTAFFREKIVLSIGAGRDVLFRSCRQVLQTRAAVRGNYSFEIAQGALQGNREKFRREPDRSGRRRGVLRISLQDECHRR